MLKSRIIAALKKAAPDIQEEAAHHITDAIIEIIIQALAEAAVKLGSKEDDRQEAD
jgi:nucleoid DNA-binding protein